jgi:hypothetical protein
MDIETMRYKTDLLSFSIQILTLLTFAYFDKNHNTKGFYTLIDKNLLDQKNKDVAIKDLYIRFFEKMKGLQLNEHTIFMHNLGKFDGFHLIADLVKYRDFVKNLHSISDNKNSYLQIKAQIFDMTLM